MICLGRPIAYALILCASQFLLPTRATCDVPSSQDFTAIAAGAYHSLALRSDGSLAAWGWNDYGQSDAPSGNDFVAISAGEWHSVAIRKDGSIVAWGRNRRGEIDVPNVNDVIAVESSRYHNVALQRDGSLVSWGDDEFGQTSHTPSERKFTAVACGLRHSLALRRDGTLIGWGSNELGHIDVPSGNDFTAISAGGYHSLALRADGSVAAWGRLSDAAPSPPHADFKRIADAAFEPFFAVGQRQDGSLFAWGNDGYGQIDVPTGTDFVAVDCGWWNGLALRADGSLVQWGYEVPDGLMSVTADGERRGHLPTWRTGPPNSSNVTLYRGGVPHTDRQGRKRLAYDEVRSFWPIGIYGYADDSDWASLGRSGVNTITHGIRTPENFRELLDRYDLQVIWTSRGDREHWRKMIDHWDLRSLRDRMLAQYAIDEPYVFTTGSNHTSDDPINEIQKGWQATFSETRSALKHFFPDLPVYVNLSPQVDAPQNGWGRWIQRSDIGSLDNYPFANRDGVRETGLSSVARSIWAVATAGDEKKPIWYVAQTFELVLPDRDWHHRFPTPDELRGSVYAAVIHGATGVIYWVWDHPGWRTGRVIGMSENPPERPNSLAPATPIKRIQSQAVWAAASQVNKELAALKPVLLAPTVGPEISYSVTITKGKPKTSADIRGLLKPHPEGGYVLLTVNLNEVVLLTRIEFPMKIQSAEAMFENRRPLRLNEEKTAFMDQYLPLDVHVVRIVPED